MNDIEVDILLVEDSQDDIDLALHTLRRENLANHIFVVRDGEEALDFLFCSGPYSDRNPAQLPKLVLLDLKLPKIDGLDVLRQLRADHRTSTLPIVIMTSSKEEKDVANSYHLRVNSFIQKPVDFEQFRQTVKSIGMYWLLINQRPRNGVVKKADEQVKL
jgi:two-component system, response regulator